MKNEHKEGKSFYGNTLSSRGAKQEPANKICQPKVINGGRSLHGASLVLFFLLKCNVIKWKLQFGSSAIDVQAGATSSFVGRRHKQQRPTWSGEWDQPRVGRRAWQAKPMTSGVAIEAA